MNKRTKRKFTELRVLPIFLLLALASYFTAIAIHESINAYIVKSVGLQPTIHFGRILGTDCPWNCQSLYYANAWTTYNGTLSQANQSRFYSEIDMNESALYGSVLPNIFTIIFFMFILPYSVYKVTR